MEVTNVGTGSAPQITSDGGNDDATISLMENATEVTTVTAEDNDSSNLNFSISGGADAGLFNIDPNTGLLTFNSPPDFEYPDSADGTNIYEVVVKVFDGINFDTQTISVKVTDDPTDGNAPVFVSIPSVSVVENQSFVTTIEAQAANPANGLGYSIDGGADAEKFAIDANGNLSFLSPPDFESPADVGENNLYEVVVKVTDGFNSSKQTFLVEVKDDPSDGAAPVIDPIGPVEIAENQTFVADLNATNSDTPPAELKYSIAGGADGGLFKIDSETGALSFVDAPDYEYPNSADGDNGYEVVVKVWDGVNSDMTTVTVTGHVVDGNAPVFKSDADVSIVENETFVVKVEATDDDVGDALTYSIVGGADKNLFQIDGKTGVLTFKEAPDFESPTDQGKNEI